MHVDTPRGLGMVPIGTDVASRHVWSIVATMVVLVATGAAVAGGTLSSGGLTAVSATVSLAGLAVIAGEIRSDRRHAQIRAGQVMVLDRIAILSAQVDLIGRERYISGYLDGAERRPPVYPDITIDW
jgi:hypothetical protein